MKNLFLSLAGLSAAMVAAAGCSDSGRSAAGGASRPDGVMAELYRQDPGARARVDGAYAYAVLDGRDVVWYTPMGAGSGPLTPEGAVFEAFAASARGNGTVGGNAGARGVVIVEDRAAFERLADGVGTPESRARLAGAHLRPDGEAAEGMGVSGVTYYRIGAVEGVTTGVQARPTGERTTGTGSGTGNLDGRFPPTSTGRPGYETESVPRGWR